MIPVTRTFLPPLEEFTARLEAVWASGWITNNGAQVKELTAALKSRLDAPNLVVVGNGTLALQLAIRALGLEGEIVTTPYSYVASVTSVLWEGCEPVFADIDESTLCIDPQALEAAVGPRTSAILATHVYGLPCDVHAIERIAKRHGLRVIYDAAHAFGVKLEGSAIVGFGDVSALSFHATKPFHTAEGGALVCRDPSVARQAELLRAFGHVGEDDYIRDGINAKMSELHAALGLCMLPRMDEIVASRREASERYDRLLAGVDVRRIQPPANVEYNFAYYPVIFGSHEAMMRVREALIAAAIGPRRYFYPSLNRLPYLAAHQRRPCPVSESVSERVLCLPLYAGLEASDVEKVARTVRAAL